MWRVALCVVLLFVRVASFGSPAPTTTGAAQWEAVDTAATTQSTEILPYIPAWRSILDRMLRRALRRAVAEATPRICALHRKAGYLFNWTGYGCSALLSNLVGPAGRIWGWLLS